MSRKIITTHIYPPIPVRRFDWMAHFEGDEEGPTGYGYTEEEAVQEFVEAALMDAYAQGREDQRADDATTYAREQCETAASLAVMRD